MWAAATFAGIIGDILVTQQAPGVIKRLRWNGVEFVVRSWRAQRSSSR